MDSSTLLSIPLFDGMVARDAEPFAAVGEAVSFSAGDRMLTFGEVANSLYYILSGEVTVKVLDENQIPTMVRVIGPGGLAGWSAVIPPHRATATLAALTNVEAVRFDGEKLRETMRQNPEAGMALLINISAVISERLEEARKGLARSLRPKEC